jgi:hypothetical protein
MDVIPVKPEIPFSRACVHEMAVSELVRRKSKIAKIGMLTMPGLAPLTKSGH